MDPENRKKVLFMITKGNFGGAQRYVFDLATNLPHEKFEVIVACGEGKVLKEKLQEKKIGVIEIPGLVRDITFVYDVVSFLNILKIIRETKPDVLHLNSSKAGALGAIAGRVLGIKKIIFTGHGWAFNEKRFFLSKILIGFVHWITIIFSHKTIAVSQKTAQDIAVLPFVKRKIVQIYNGVNQIDFYERGVARKELASEIMKERMWVGAVGELHRTTKGYDLLIEAFSQIKNLNDCVCIIIGEGEGRKDFEKIIKDRKLEQKVFLVGFKKDASKFLKAFDIYCVPSRTEAFPYSPLEAGMAGLPVIASGVGGIPEIIEDGKSGLLHNPENVEEIRNMLDKLVGDEKLREKLGENLHKKIEREFTLQKMVDNTTSVYLN